MTVAVNILAFVGQVAVGGVLGLLIGAVLVTFPRSPYRRDAWPRSYRPNPKVGDPAQPLIAKRGPSDFSR